MALATYLRDGRGLDSIWQSQAEQIQQAFGGDKAPSGKVKYRIRCSHGVEWARHSLQHSAVSWLNPRHCELLEMNVVDLPDECLVTMSFADDRSSGQGGPRDGGEAGRMYIYIHICICLAYTYTQLHPRICIYIHVHKETQQPVKPACR